MPDGRATASTTTARAVAAARRFQGGRARACATSVGDLGGMGVGIGLYFKLLKALSFFFLFASVLALPAILSSAAQRGMGEEQRDALGLGTLTLGNQGLSTEAVQRCRRENAALPSAGGRQDCNGTTLELRLPKLGLVWSDVDAFELASVISVCDLVMSIAFLLLVLWLRRDVQRYAEENDRNNLTGSDYTVFVRGLPHDTTEREVLAHFASRYPVTHVDADAAAIASFVTFPMLLGCCGKPRRVRPPPEAAALAAPRAPVRSTEHLRHGRRGDMYHGTSIAEVSIARSNAALLRACLHSTALARRRKVLIARLEQCRAKADAKRAAAAEAALSRLEQRIEKATARLRQKQLGKHSKGGGGKLSEELDAVDLLARGRCECAFVVFNSDVAAARCQHDYRTSKGAVARLFQPAALRFRGSCADATMHRLTVERAPEPSNVLWENLEMLNRPWATRMRHATSALVTFLIVLVSFVLVFAAQKKSAEFAARMPQAELCKVDIPAVHFGRYESGAAAAALDASDRSRLVENNSMTAALCGAGEFHVTFPNAYGSRPHGTATSPTGHTQLPKVVTAPQGPCSGAGNATLCNAQGDARGCVSMDDTTACCTLPCVQESVGDGQKCVSYQRGTIVGCLCKDRLQERIAKLGFIAGAREVVDDPVCGQFAESMLISQSLVFGAAAAVALVNTLLKAFLTALSRFERHPALSAQASSAASKIFAAQFFNTALIVLLVNARLPQTVDNPVPPEWKLLHGEFADHTRQWYAVVGVALTLTLLLNVFLPHIPVLVAMAAIRLKRVCAVARHGHTLTQAEMNELWVWPEFDISSRLPVLLNTVFSCMLYSGGVPILMPLAFFAIALTLLVDKYTITRLYSMPPAYDETLALGALGFLPYALLGHVGMACWMFSNNELLKSELLNPAELMGQADLDSADAVTVDAAYQAWLLSIEDDDPFGITARIARWNVMPHVVLFVLLLAMLLVDGLAGRLLYPILRRVCAPCRLFVSRCLQCHQSRTQVQPAETLVLAAASDMELRFASPNPDLTAPFSFAVAPGTALSMRETAAGWKIGIVQGQVRKFRAGADGELLRTWQVMTPSAGTPGHSYDLLCNANYAKALALLDLPSHTRRVQRKSVPRSTFRPSPTSPREQLVVRDEGQEEGRPGEMVV